jgi:hypothetical protein
MRNVMLSERQIEYLLKECEARLNAPLAGLRERLLRDRNYAGSIFELVLLYVLLNRFERVEPETGPGMPDVIIRGRWRHRLSLEAAVVSSPSSAELAKSSEFNRWLYREIVKLMPIKGASIVIDPKPGKTDDARVPPAHRWPVMQKDPSWHVFVGQVRDQGQARWECPEGNISVHFKARQDEYLTAQPLAPARPTDITRHPVYREIRRKARQAKRWPRHLRKRPIALVICTPGGGREFWSGHDVDDYSIHRAVFSALLDHERMNDLDRINVLRQRLKFRPQHPTGVYVEPNRLRVAGSELISAVLIVRMEQDHGRAAQPPKSTAKPELYFNRHSRHPLPEGLAAEIRKLDFNAIEYGPGWEAWHDTERESLKVRNLRRGGLLEFRTGRKPPATPCPRRRSNRPTLSPGRARHGRMNHGRTQHRHRLPDSPSISQPAPLRGRWTDPLSGHCP